jgi:hypothetical protein
LPVRGPRSQVRRRRRARAPRAPLTPIRRLSRALGSPPFREVVRAFPRPLLPEKVSHEQGSIPKPKRSQTSGSI